MEPVLLSASLDRAPTAEVVTNSTQMLTSVEDLSQVPPKAKAEAYELYLNSAGSMLDIAVNTGLTEEIVRAMVKRYKWENRKREIDRELVLSVESKYKQFTLSKRLITAERQWNLATKLENIIDNALKDYESGELESKPNALKQLAEAINSITSVSGRIAGISEKLVERVDEATGGSMGRPSVIINNVTPQAPAVPRTIVATIEGEVTI